ncbi:hypothetical protein JAAARDRAFT_205547 [Jaapia argillacea MUCL 33604]|uniref:Uncharacterized protein n=1 Tax=Jaapia argillacea MUCL 33604 TaxID=933084 RepID=A0A067Q047_9AGAM|nr:hypothetical protein JAAARDRAFT_205547 [Jaapia argillacea MUCL 33604]
MVMMDIDMHSPSRRSFSGKRPRSPDPSNLCDRPSKRLSLALNDRLTSSLLPTIHVSAPGSRHSSEDWVSQTRGLRLNSPLIPGGFILPQVVQEASGDDESNSATISDESMTMDSEENISVCIRNLLDVGPIQPGVQSPESQSSLIRIDTPPSLHSPQPIREPSPSFLPYSVLQQFASASQPPSFSAQPDSSPEPLRSPWNASSPPRGSTDQISSPTPTSRKQHFTMGPRADCEKCRLGVKGHWMHFD